MTNIIPLPTPAAPMTTKYLPYKPEGIPQALREHPHWLVADRRGRPVRRPGVGNSKTNPEHWAAFDTASRIAVIEPGLWPYIVLTDDSVFTVFDVDFKPRRENETPAQYEARIQRAERALESVKCYLFKQEMKSGVDEALKYAAQDLADQDELSYNVGDNPWCLIVAICCIAIHHITNEQQS